MGRIVITLLVVVTMAAVPLASAGYGTFGEIVDGTASATDVTHLLTISLAAAPGAELMFCDDKTTNGVWDSGEGVYVDTDAGGAVNALDIRLHEISSSLKGGEFVDTTDADACKAPASLSAAAGGWGFVDLYPEGAVDGVLNLGEPVILDIGTSAGFVDAGDLEIVKSVTTKEEGQAVKSGVASFKVVGASPSGYAIGAALVDLYGGATYGLSAFDADGDGVLSHDDHVYFDTDGNGYPGPGDVRLTKAGSNNAGEMPEAADSDTVHFLQGAVAAAEFGYEEVSSAGVQATEEVYLDMDGDGTAELADVMLHLGSSSSSNGLQIKAASAQAGTSLVDVATEGGALMFIDNAPTGWNIGDVMFLEVDGDGLVEAADVRLGASSGTVPARATGSEIGQPLTALPGSAVVSFYDFAGGSTTSAQIFNYHDVPVIDMDGDGLVSSRDIIFAKGKSPFAAFGKIVDDGHAAMVFCYAAAALGTAAFGYIEEGGAGIVNLEEPMYWESTGNLVTDGTDIRATPVTGSGNAGTFVTSGDNDNGKPLSAIPGTGSLAFRDDDGSGGFSHGDAIYFDLDDSQTVTVGDLRISKPGTSSKSPGSRVIGGDADLSSAALTDFAAFPWRWIDSDADGSFDRDDEVYANLDAAAETAAGLPACVTPKDLRYSGSGGAGGGGGGGGGGPTINLNSGTVVPEFAASSVNRDFRVNWRHSDNIAPSTRDLVLTASGNRFSMSTTDTTYTDGSVFTVGLADLDQNTDYYFQFSSGSTTLRFPTSGSLTVYVDPGTPMAPLGLGPDVSSTLVEAGAEVTFSVTYMDANNEAPTRAKVFINSHPMEADLVCADTTYYDGSVCSYSTALDEVGEHRYWFELSDGATTIRLPEDPATSYAFTVNGTAGMPGPAPPAPPPAAPPAAPPPPATSDPETSVRSPSPSLFALLAAVGAAIVLATRRGDRRD